MSAKEERSNYLCTDDDLNSLTDYFNAALTGEESKSRLQQMWEQEIGIIKATQRAAKQYELPACESDKPYGIPSHPATKICTECRASKCCVLWDCPLRNEIWKAAQEKLMDELGLLHGEDAQRFNEQLDHPEPLTPEARDLVMQAKEIAKRERMALDDRDRLIREDERKRVLKNSLEALDKISEQYNSEDNDGDYYVGAANAISESIAAIESFQSEITNQRSEQ